MERMTYSEAAESTDTITAGRAYREVVRHQCDWAEFLADFGSLDSYRTCDVLRWLGY